MVVLDEEEVLLFLPEFEDEPDDLDDDLDDDLELEEVLDVVLSAGFVFVSGEVGLLSTKDGCLLPVAVSVSLFESLSVG